MGANDKQIAVFGAGYVGLVTGACFAELGHRVIVRDVIPEKVEALRRGEVPIYEPGLDELLERNRERISFTTDVAEAMDGAEFVYVAVGTPPTYSGDADLSAVWTVIDELPDVEQRIVVAMKSTVPVGTGAKARHRLDARGLGHVGYVSNPEFTAEGTAVKDFMEPDRIVIGAFAAADADAVASLHDGIDAPIVRADVASAEMIKLAANAALMTRISFINEIANVCEATGADVVKVAEGIGYDRRIGKSFLRAGVGFGGSCFPKDSLALKQLAANSGYHFQVLNAVIEVNELQKRRVIGKLAEQLGSLRGRRIALLGLAFKPHTDDTREAPAFVLAGRLMAEGADVRRVGPDRELGRPPRRGAGCERRGRGARGRRSRARDGMARARGCRLERRRRDDALARVRRRAEHARPGRHARRGIPVRSDRARLERRALMEAIVLAGGQAERLGDAAGGLPKSLVPVGGRPLLAWQVGRLAAAGVERVIVSCLGGQEAEFQQQLDGLGVELVCAGEPERLGRGGGIRFAAGSRRESGDVLAMNGDELVDVDFGALLDRHRSTGAAATLTVAQPPSQFGQVDLTEDDVVTGFHEVSRVPYWVNCGIYVLSEEALARFPEKGDHETTAFPELAGEGRLRAFRHTGTWLTVNTPKELRRADEYVAEHPEWLA